MFINQVMVYIRNTDNVNVFVIYKNKVVGFLSFDKYIL